MSTAPERESSKGLRTSGTCKLFDRLLSRLTDAQVSAEMIGHTSDEGKDTFVAQDAAAKGRIGAGYRDARRAVRESLRRLGRLQNFKDDWSLVNATTDEEIAEVVEEISLDGNLNIRMNGPAVVQVNVPVPPPSVPSWTGAPPPKPLSETERAILMKTARNGKLDHETVTNATLSDDDVLLQAVEEQNRQEKAKKIGVQWACKQADNAAAEHATKIGEALWAAPISVETHEESGTKVILVRSSTAPMFGTHGPVVKFDFRANGVPVNHKHPDMFRQLDGLKLIRSRVTQKGTHEYYVKGLNYRNGMIFKGYMEVNGEEDSGLTRFFQIRGEKVVRISENEYRDVENRLAAGEDAVPS